MNVYTKQKQTDRKQICGYQTRGEERQSRSAGSTVQTTIHKIGKQQGYTE